MTTSPKVYERYTGEKKAKTKERKTWYRGLLEDKPISNRERAFAWAYTFGILNNGQPNATEAYMNVYFTKRRIHARNLSTVLLRTKRVQEEILTTMAIIASNQGVTDKFILEQAKKAVEDAEAEKKVLGLRYLAELLQKGGFNKRPDSQLNPKDEIPLDEVPIIDADSGTQPQLGEGQDSK